MESSLRLVRNSGKCRKCGDEIESKSRHDFVECGCGAVAVDGGKAYARQVGRIEDFEDTSVWEES